MLDEEIFGREAMARLDHQFRREVDRRRTVVASDGIAALEHRALDLTNRIAEGARRFLMAGENLISEVNAALAEFKDEVQRVQSAIEAKRRTATLPADGDELVRRTLDGFRSIASVMGDPTFPLGRRRDVLRRLFSSRDGV